MKKRIIGLALIIASFVSITSGCYVGYGYHRHYDRDHEGHYDHDNHRDHDEHDHHDD
ncbi:MAG: hypothetical protein JWP44_3784 [Mucilaginibacter sp.]|nr:hypothetical protein [Mucilaginibacter sp.]